MPNIKSAKKRVKVNAVKTMNNQIAKSALRTTLKKFDAAVAAGDKANATAVYTTAVKAVDQAAAKHLLHKNNAANKKSKMTIKLNGMA
ncbi:MAG: 30S ribosomal protein S20 [Eubacteriales bacterium]|nr:30S ribosomal protein S20 [Eubacteriales bacterium]